MFEKYYLLFEFAYAMNIYYQFKKSTLKNQQFQLIKRCLRRQIANDDNHRPEIMTNDYITGINGTFFTELFMASTLFSYCCAVGKFT